MLAGHLLDSKARRTMRIRKCLKEGSRKQIIQYQLILEDSPLIFSGRCIPGVTMFKRMAPELVPQPDEFLQIIRFEHGPERGLFSHEAQGCIVCSQGTIST